MGRYWRIYKAFFSSALIRETQFRANFFAKVGENIIWSSFFVMILLVIYRNTDSVAGWTRGDAFILVATVFLMEALHAALFMSLMEIPEQVRQGTLDFVLLKPVDSQFWVSTRRFNFSQGGTLIAGTAMVVIGIAQAGVHPDALQWLAYAVGVASALGLFYALNISMMTLGIWLVRVDNLWVLGESVLQVARFPLDIFQLSLRRLLTYAVPLGFLATVPARQLTQGLDVPMAALGLAYAGAAVVGARVFWRFALTHYQSASS